MSNSRSNRISAKIDLLTNSHGLVFSSLWNQGKISSSAIPNLFGRHMERQRAIFSAMSDGHSYWKAYELSDEFFDTKRWSKIPRRSSCCRGLVLTSLYWVQQKTELIPDEVRNVGLELADAIVVAAKQQLQRLALVPWQPDAGSFKKAKVARKELPATLLGPKKTLADLRSAKTKLEKNARDIPAMCEFLGEQPSLRDVAATAIETAQMVLGATAIVSVLDVGKVEQNLSAHFGSQYRGWFSDAGVSAGAMLRVATHKLPDADALVATWMMQRFVLDGTGCQVEFVPRNYVPSAGDGFDAVLDVGRKHDPNKLLFDHKPPAFAHRDLHCATSLVFDHARSIGCRVEMLRDLVNVIHDGDAATRRTKSAAYQASGTNGLHALIKAARCYAESDSMLYHGVAAFLDATYLWPSD